MDLSNLVYIIEVAAEKSISKAAKKSYISQSNLSRIIQEVETNIGTPIFIRTNKGVELTEAGEEFIDTSLEIVRLSRSLRTIEYRKNKKKSLRLSSIKSPIGLKTFYEIHDKYSEYENIDFRIRETTSNLVIRDIFFYYSDIGVIHMENSNKSKLLNMFEQDNIVYEKICELIPYAVFRKGHPLEDNELLNLEDIYEYGNINYDLENHIFENHISDINPYENTIDIKRFKKVISVIDRASLNDSIRNTDYIYIDSLPKDYMIGNSEYIIKPIKNSNIKILELGLVYLKEIELSEIDKEYIEKIKNNYKK